eukprot:11189325-Lingulodinium_polyedra.AAC.1
MHAESHPGKKEDFSESAQIQGLVLTRSLASSRWHGEYLPARARHVAGGLQLGLRAEDERLVGKAGRCH